MLSGWSTKRVRIVVKTYPTPAQKGVEVSCTAGVTWESRRFLASITRQAIKDCNATRDEHWLQKNPIDYA